MIEFEGRHYDIAIRAICNPEQPDRADIVVYHSSDDAQEFIGITGGRLDLSGMLGSLSIGWDTTPITVTAYPQVGAHPGSTIVLGRYDGRRFVLMLMEQTTDYDRVVSAMAQVVRACMLPAGDLDLPDIGVFGVCDRDYMHIDGVPGYGIGVGFDGEPAVFTCCDSTDNDAILVYLVAHPGRSLAEDIRADRRPLRDAFTSSRLERVVIADAGQSMRHDVTLEDIPQSWLPTA